MKFKKLKEVFEYLDTINNDKSMMYDDCRWNSYDSLEDYEDILKYVLEDKPKRVVDIGSNLNQFGYLFANEGIEYIGIDKSTTLPYDGIMQPLITDKIKFVRADYKDVREHFKNDVIISNLCVGYEVPLKEVLCKKLITKNGVLMGDEINNDTRND